MEDNEKDQKNEMKVAQMMLLSAMNDSSMCKIMQNLPATKKGW